MNANDHALNIAFIREATAAQMLGVSKRTISAGRRKVAFLAKLNLAKTPALTSLRR
ncbi:hypothetical protein [Aquitalea magnusonii]|uniref:hypothetical protein n=1 Tax=Aquitalea magnusonii TaxID=332411 RepID=UPI001EFA68D0|nr:hypothetical protein [Aquitalea magnusonii]